MLKLKPQAKKERENRRCCWVCGKASGAIYGFTNALRIAGYETAHKIGYAHIHCMNEIRTREQEQ